MSPATPVLRKIVEHDIEVVDNKGNTVIITEDEVVELHPITEDLVYLKIAQDGIGSDFYSVDPKTMVKILLHS